MVFYKIKWYSEKEKAYKEDYVKSIDDAFKMAAKAFDEESKYYNVEQITIK